MAIELQIFHRGKMYRWPVSEKSITVGSSPSCELILKNFQVEKSHCSIFLENGKVKVVDHKSKSGTFIDHVKVTEGNLYVGQSLVIASMHLKINESLLSKDEIKKLKKPADATMINYKFAAA